MRPLKYGEEMILVPIRMPKSKVKDIKKLIVDYLKSFEVGGETTKPFVEIKAAETPKPKPKWQIDAETRNKRRIE